MDKSTSTESIPVLKDKNGNWAVQAGDKADILADTFASKHRLLPREINAYSGYWPVNSHDNFVPIRTRAAQRVLAALRIDSGTGQDGVATRVLKTCAHELAVPLAILARMIIDESRWPECWVLHWVLPLYKRKSVYSPENYRGIHLTSQVAKSMERLLGSFFFPVLELAAFGDSQFAYRKAHGSRDALAYYLMWWIQA